MFLPNMNRLHVSTARLPDLEIKILYNPFRYPKNRQIGPSESLKRVFGPPTNFQCYKEISMLENPLSRHLDRVSS